MLLLKPRTLIFEHNLLCRAVFVETRDLYYIIVTTGLSTSGSANYKYFFESDQSPAETRRRWRHDTQVRSQAAPRPSWPGSPPTTTNQLFRVSPAPPGGTRQHYGLAAVEWKWTTM